jgi:hypothetical protein
LQGDGACRLAGIEKKKLCRAPGRQIEGFLVLRKNAGLQAVKKAASLLLEACQKCDKRLLTCRFCALFCSFSCILSRLCEAPFKEGERNIDQRTKNEKTLAAEYPYLLAYLHINRKLDKTMADW